MPEKTADQLRTSAMVNVSIVGIVGNMVLAVLKIVTGLLASSFALLADGIDSATDIITSAITLFAARIINQPPDKGHPYGHGRAEAIATKLLSFIIFFAGFQLAVSTVNKLINNQEILFPGKISLAVAGISIAGKIVLALYKYSVGKRINSLMLIADAKNMRNDVFISASVLIGLVCTFVFHVPVLDRFIALAVSLWIIKSAVSIFMENSVELMDGNEDHELYTRIFDAVANVKGASNPHRTRLRRLGDKYIIDMDIEVDGDLCVRDAHEIAMNVERKVSETLDNVYDVIVHIEPEGNIEHNERYGLSQQKLQDGK